MVRHIAVRDLTRECSWNVPSYPHAQAARERAKSPAATSASATTCVLEVLLLGFNRINNLEDLELQRCPRLWKLDLRGTGYLRTREALPPLPQVTELRGPGWQDVGVRGRVID